MAIIGGYYLKARCIQKSTIAHMPPHVREIWDWLLMKANHKDVIHHGTLIKRGQCIKTYEDIQEGLHWMVGWRKMKYSKWDCEKAMKVLKKATMIATRKTTRGLFITICNYDYYQNAKNYESHIYDPTTKATREPQSADTINKNDKNDKELRINTLSVRFEIFFKAYPKKKSKGQAEKTWHKLKPSEQLLETMLSKIEIAKTSKEWTKDGGEYIPYPSTWLNAKGWEDEYGKSAQQIEYDKLEGK